MRHPYFQIEFPAHSALMLAARITLLHFSVSSAKPLGARQCPLTDAEIDGAEDLMAAPNTSARYKLCGSHAKDADQRRK
jgi:hypothetical protein